MEPGTAVFLAAATGDLDDETIYYYVGQKSVDTCVIATDRDDMQSWHEVPCEFIRPVLKET
jgi:hypothetical protein